MVYYRSPILVSNSLNLQITILYDCWNLGFIFNFFYIQFILVLWLPMIQSYLLTALQISIFSSDTESKKGGDDSRTLAGVREPSVCGGTVRQLCVCGCCVICKVFREEFAVSSSQKINRTLPSRPVQANQCIQD